MAWDHLSINRPHLVYIILGGFTSLFMLCSSFIKERLYIGEATVATICGIIFGPHAADLINPLEWGNTDQITLEFSRIVLVVQCFAVGVELPKYYMEKHWRSVIFLLIPVMTFGWLITSLFIWWMILPLTWLESLCVAACVTATDPVLASSVVGKGKFAKRVPKHLRDLLSAESGCNDGMAFPFIYLSLYLIKYRTHPDEVAFHWIVLSILYECVFGAFYGFMIGYIGRHGIKYAEKHDLVDRESFLVFYFVLALFCAGSGSILGVDDLLVGFAAGIGFSNDGWFTQKTEESHVSNVIDLLINLAYFVYLGTIIPWEQFNMPEIGTTPWRLVVISIFVLFFRRIPIMMALKPLIPDIKTWREALFAGHFGPIGVGAIFVAILARAELETDSTTPLASYPDPNAENYMVVTLIWPITVFLVVVSILVHGSSIAVFTLGKHINTLTLTMSYTTAHEDGPSWMNRLPRITTTSKSQAKSVTSENGDDLDLPPGALPPTGMPREFLRRQKEEDTGKTGKRSSSLIPRRRKKKSHEDAGGPISESAIFPQRRPIREDTSDTLTPGEISPEDEKQDYDEKEDKDVGEVQRDPETRKIMDRHSGDSDRHGSKAERHPDRREVYQEGDDLIIENEDGDVIRTVKSPSATRKTPAKGKGKANLEGKTGGEKKEDTVDYMNYKKMIRKLDDWRHRDDDENPNNPTLRKRGPALAYQIGNTIIVEDEDGEVVKTYELPSRGQGGESSRPGAPRKLSTWAGLATGLTGGLVGSRKTADDETTKEGATTQYESSASAVRQGIARMGTWGWGGKASDSTEKNAEDDEEDDDRRIRFMIGGAGRRLTKNDFLREIQTMDPKSRAEMVESSDASPAFKAIAHQDNLEASPLRGGRGLYPPKAKIVSRPKGRDLEETEDETDSEEERRRRKSGQAALQLSRKKDAPISSGTAEKSYEEEEPETAAERKRRLQALKGVEDEDEDEDYDKPESSSSGSRGRRSRSRSVDGDDFPETAAERRRREAALGFSGQRDGSRDAADEVTTSGEITVPQEAVKPLRGIRFAESPVRAAGEAKGKK